MTNENEEVTKEEVLLELNDVFLGASTPKMSNYVYSTVVEKIGYDPTTNEEDPRYDEYWNRSTQLIRKLFVEMLTNIGPYDGVIETISVPELNKSA